MGDVEVEQERERAIFLLVPCCQEIHKRLCKRKLLFKLCRERIANPIFGILLS